MDNEYEFINIMEEASNIIMVTAFSACLSMELPEYEKKMGYALKKAFKKIPLTGTYHKTDRTEEVERDLAQFVLFMNNTHLLIIRALVTINSIKNDKIDADQEVFSNTKSFSYQLSAAIKLGWIDSREKYALYNFNSFRNSVIHSYPLMIFRMMPKEDRKSALLLMQEVAYVLKSLVSYTQTLGVKVDRSLGKVGTPVTTEANRKLDEYTDRYKTEEEKNENSNSKYTD